MTQNPCQACGGRGLVLADLRRFRLGEGFTAFMAAGARRVTHDDGSCWHEIVCTRCDGAGTKGGSHEAEATPP